MVVTHDILECMPADSKPYQRGREGQIGRQIALVSMSVGLVLSLAKILVGAHASSASVVSDGMEAAGDVLASAIVYAGLWLASKPPDKEHPYGHGRYETLAGLGVGAMLLIAGTAIFWHSLTHLSEQNHHLASYALYPLIAAVVIWRRMVGTTSRTWFLRRSPSLRLLWHWSIHLLLGRRTAPGA